MTERETCPKCGAGLPADAPAGICPKCLMAAGLESQSEVQNECPKSDPEAPTIDNPSPGAGFLPPSPEVLAEKFPQLEIVELLGHGGMGAVYMANQTNLDRLVALKIIRPEATHDPAFSGRFNREAKTLARLSHQHIVAVHDFGEVEYSEADEQPSRPLYYFLMEYVDGANLRQLMRSGELTPEQALAIVPQICDALQYAHDEGVVHRDIKPENILLDKRGRVKIADFGLAKLATRSEADLTLTGTHQVMGTLRYMAPEQLEGPRGVDHRADIYSLGVVFYEMLTGEAPMGHFDPPSKKVQLDVRLDEVVLRTLARDPERRYQNASEVRTDVESISETWLPSNTPLASKSAPRDSDSRTPGMLRQAWNLWWAERDRWITNAVQSTLVVVFLVCMFMYLGFHNTGERLGDAKVDSEPLYHKTVVCGVPGPWLEFESYPDEKTPFRWKIDWISSSTGIMLLGFLAWCLNWQIERAKAHSSGKQLRWWHGSPNFAIALWGVGTVTVVFIAFAIGMPW